MNAKTLLRPWLRDDVVLESAHSRKELVETLAPDVAPTAKGYAGYPFQAANGFTLTGQVAPDAIAVMASKNFSRNAWRPELTGRFEEQGFGSRFVGSIGIPNWVLISSGSLLTLIAVFMAMANSAGWGDAVGISWLIVVLALITMGVGAYVGAKERDLLLTWLNGHLEPVGTSTDDGTPSSSL